MNINLSLEKSVLAVVMTTSFLAPFIGSSINLAIPAIGTELNGTALQLSWVVTGFLLASAAFLLPFGRLADIVGRRKVFITGILLFSLFSLLCGLVQSMGWLIFYRAWQGLAASMIFGTGIAILTSVYPPDRRGRALGITAAATYIGLSLGPVLGGFMTYQLGWRSIFYFTAVIGALAALLAAWRLKGEWAGARGERFDLAGSICYMLSLTAILYSLSSLSKDGWAKYALLAGLALMALFLRYEAGLTYPVLQVNLFRRNVVFAFSNLAAMINYSATFAVGFIISLYLQVIMGYDSRISGLILLAQPVMMALFSPLAGTASDRIEPRLVASAGMALSSAGLFLFIFINPGTPVWLIMINLALIGLGFALFSSPNNNAIMGAVEQRFYGVAASALATMRLIGQAVSMAVVTLIISAHIGDSGLEPHNSNLLAASARTAFMLFTATCVIGVFASLARGKQQPPTGRQSPGEARKR